jgi:hypothetical protein
MALIVKSSPAPLVALNAFGARCRVMAFSWLRLVGVRSLLLPPLFLTFFLVRRLDQQKQRLEDDEEAAEQRLVELQSQLSEAVGRLSRIRKIRKRVQNRSAELVERGLAELDKEVSGPPPDLLPALAAHEEWMVTDLRDMGVPNDADWSALGLSDFADVGPLVSSSEAPRPSETV